MSENNLTPDLRVELELASDHAAYAGHFPGRPMLPGAVLLDEALNAIARSRSLDLTQWRIASAKFLGPVKPGDALILECSAPSESTIRFSIRGPRGAVASGMLSHGA